MLRLDLFKRRNFAVGNVETFALYAGLAVLFFFLVIYLQQVAGYTRVRERPDHGARDAGDVRAVAAVRGARRPLRAALFMGGGPLLAAAGMLLLLGSARTSRTSPICCRRCCCSRSACR